MRVVIEIIGGTPWIKEKPKGIELEIIDYDSDECPDGEVSVYGENEDI